MSALPKVWSRFTLTKGSTTLKFMAVEPPADRVNDVADFLSNYFMKEENMLKASGVPNSEAALEEFSIYFKGCRTDGSQHQVICCLDNGDDQIGEIIGGSFIALTKKDEPKDTLFQPETKEARKMMEMIFAFKDMFNTFDALNVDSYYDGRGVVVHPKYRGWGIAQELLRTRRLICKEHNIPATVALMTADGSQKAAERDNWETIFEFNFHEFGQKHGVSFEGSPETAKFMAARAT